ncbi:RibD family protein [Vreelandella aquamarina]|uniref:RibD family protein n=1 Tax=Vreelandella aquamarina TaxID=77097 RepID=UPI0038508AAD
MVHNDFLTCGSGNRRYLHRVGQRRMMRRLILRGGAMPSEDQGDSAEPLGTLEAWEWLLALRHGTGVAHEELSTRVDGHWESTCPVTPDATELLDCWMPLVTQTPWVIAQLGQSMDGRIATQSGHSHYINGRESLTHLHRLRAMCDAVIVGAGTACADDPQLTVRHVSGQHPLRVVLDPRGRVPDDLALMSNASAATLHLIGPDVERPAPPDHVSRQRLGLDAQGQFTPQTVIETLARLGHRRILVEGGGITVSQFIDAGCVDRLHLLVAPLLIGSGRPGLVLPPIDTLETALRPTARRFRLGDDTLFDLDLRCT